MSPSARVTFPSLPAPGARSTSDPEAPDLAEALAHTPPPFDGFPYLVTRIVRTALRHIAVVPADWPRDRLVELAIRQATTNRLETCLCLGPADAVFVSPAGVAREAAFVPTGLPVLDRLVIAGPLPETAELAARRDVFRAYARRWQGTGHIVGDGLEGGRPATPADVARLTGPAVDGMPAASPAGGEAADERAMSGDRYAARRPRAPNGQPQATATAMVCTTRTD